MIKYDFKITHLADLFFSKFIPRYTSSQPFFGTITVEMVNKRIVTYKIVESRANY